MANTKKLRKAAAKFRKTEPALHKLYSVALDYMGQFIRQTGATEVTCVIRDNKIIECYADE